jgi:CelD/BcsL family acetyltransferase involved in cellulose biosynthesis
MIEIREYDRLGDERLVEAWMTLESSGACPSLFLSRAWMEPWAKQFEDEFRPSILVGYDGADAIGVAPLFTTSRETYELPVNFLAHRGGLIALDDARGEFAMAVVRRLDEWGRGALLKGLPVDCPSHRSLVDAARASGCPVHERRGRVSPHVDVSSSWDEFLKSKPSRVSHEWRRKMRKLEREGSVEVKRMDPGMSPHDLMDEFVDVESRSWKEDAGTSISGRGIGEFYHELAESLTRAGVFRPFWIELDQRMIGFLLGAVHGGVYYALKTSFDEAFGKLSPGVTLFDHAIGDAFSEGLDRFDFTGQRARWKDELATGHTEHVDVRLYPRGPRGRLACFLDSHAKPAAKRLLGRDS